MGRRVPQVHRQGAPGGASVIIELLIIITMLVGLPLLCWIDPAGHYAAEVRRRQEDAP
jgi:hypothetical protein